jgi:hypothetical protein
MIAKTIAKMTARIIAKRNFSGGLGTFRLFPWMVRAFSALLLLSGVAYATPITDLGSNDLQDALGDVLPLARPLDSRLSTSSNLSPATRNPGSAPYRSMSFAPSSQSSSDACVFSSNCSSTIKVPEPQSLVLVGSGLLSMAGLVRRRLLR